MNIAYYKEPHCGRRREGGRGEEHDARADDADGVERWEKGERELFVPFALICLCQQQSICKPQSQSVQARAETDQFTSLQLPLQLFGLSSNWT